MLRLMFIIVTQRTLRVFLKPIFYIFFDISLYGKENLKDVKRPMIVVMNHKSSFDAFLFGVCVPVTSEIWPLRYLVARDGFKTPVLNFLNKIGILKLITLMYGHFPVKKGAGLEKNLKMPLEALKKKEGSVAIFIEGERVFHGELGRGKPGAAFLALNSGAMIIPVSIGGNKKTKLCGFWNGCVTIKIGEPFSLKDMSKNGLYKKYEKETEFIMKKIEELYY